MLSGRETLAHLSSTLQAARKELQRLEHELQQSSSVVAQNRQRQAQSIKRLATMRLDTILTGDVVSRIDYADHEVKVVLAHRMQAMSDLNERIIAADRMLDTQEERRIEQHLLVEDAARTLAEREANAQVTLESNPAFHKLLDYTRKKDAIAVSAEEKAELAREDRRLKGQPYESDELFMYLWKRAYGTSEYHANPFARVLDAWVARLCEFRDARANYWMLTEIPKRLQEHADRVRVAADQTLKDLQTLEHTAASESGVIDAQSLLSKHEQQQDEIDNKIAQAEAEMHELRTDQNQFAAGTDHFAVQILGILSDALERREIDDLTRLARGTMTIEDDEIVAELRRLRRQDSKFEDQLRHNQERHRVYLSRVQELEQVRQRFKHDRYDDLRSEFSNGDKLIGMMREVLGGAIRGGALWDMLQGYQRYRNVADAWPDFGSGGIARTGRRAPAQRPTWHWPGPSRTNRRGGFRLPRPSASRSRSRGGFRTGGGF